MTTSDYLNQLISDKNTLVTNLTSKGISGLTGDETFTELVPEVLNIPSGGQTEAEEKDVNFYDYDGTRVYSYTKPEFLLLQDFPSNPTHEGLISQGWNWSYQDAINYVTNNGKLDIGQMYITNDDKTRIYIKLEEGRTSPYLGINLTVGTVTIDWGDGSELTEITGSFENPNNNILHNYSNPGDYVIKISGNAALMFTGDSTCGSHILWGNINNANSINKIYQNSVIKIELGITNAVCIQQYAFQNCNALQSITIPNGYITSIASSAFQNCYSLKSITLPNKNNNSIGNYCFNKCYSLKYAILAYKTKTINQYAFQDCYLLQSITLSNSMTDANTYICSNCIGLKKAIIPSNINNIQGKAFQNCYSLKSITLPNNIGLASNCLTGCINLLSMIFLGDISTTVQGIGNPSIKYYDFSNCTTIPSLTSGTFNNIPSDCKIIVPDNLYEDWIATANWSTYASYIISASDYANL